MLKRTALISAHQKLGARLVEFGGWEMPVQYSSILDEHLAVRQAAGVFDISHMGQVSVRGDAALDVLNRLLTNDVRKLAIGLGQYTLMCNARGGVIDDLYVYRLGKQEFLLIINAARIQPDLAWIEQQLAAWPEPSQVDWRDRSGAHGAVAVQGPNVKQFIGKVFAGPSVGGTAVSHVTELKKNQVASFAQGWPEAFVARTGYTGEDGFEVVAPVNLIEAIWTGILDAGRPFGLKPCGLGARDTLRTEMGYPLYGHELDEQTSPIEAGLGYFVALDKGDFIGRTVLAEQKARGQARKCVAFKMTDRSAPPRPHYAIWNAGAEARRIGEVTSGTQSPSLSVGIGLGYVAPDFAHPGTPIEIEIRGKCSPAAVVAKPIYRKSS